MDNVVTMSLEEYTKLVVENTILKNKINGLKAKALKECEDEVLASRINSLTIEDAKAALDLSDKEILSRFTYNNNWRFERACDAACNVVTVDELKAEIVTCVKRYIDGRIDLLKEQSSNQ